MTTLRPLRRGSGRLQLWSGSFLLATGVILLVGHVLTGWDGWSDVYLVVWILLQGTGYVLTELALRRQKVLLTPYGVGVSGVRTQWSAWTDVVAARRDPPGGSRLIRLALAGGKERTLPELSDDDSERLLTADRASVPPREETR